MDLSQFVPVNKIYQLLLKVAKSCEKVLQNTHTKPQDTMAVEFLESEKQFTFVNPPRAG